MRTSGVIYSITCSANGRVYIGSTTRGAKQRYSEHLHYLRKGSHHAKHLQRCFSKHGEQSLSMAIVEHVDDANFLLAREQFHIWRNESSLLNSSTVSDSTLSANAANRGRVMPDSEKAARSAALRAAYSEIDVSQRMTDEVRAKLREAWKVRKERAGKPKDLPLWVSMYSDGMTLEAIAVKTGTTKRTVSKYLKGEWIDVSRQRPHTAERIAKSVSSRLSFIDSEISGWIRMKRDGLSIRQIEKQTGRTRKVISRELAKRGAV